MANEIAAAIKILEQEKARIELALRALQGFGSSATATRGGGVSSGSGKTRKRKPLSAAARKRIAEAQRARWAKQKAEKKAK